MFKDTVTYTDYNGDTRTETLYFNLSKPEMMKLKYSVPGGMEKKLQIIVDRLENKDEDVVGEMFDFFELLIKKSYGVKTDDGHRFIKNQEVLDDFVYSEAYNVLFEKFMSDINYVAKFVMAILPADVADLMENDEEYKEVMKALDSGEDDTVSED